MNRRLFMTLGGVAGAGVIIAGRASANYATASERVSECIASVIESSAEMLRITRDHRMEFTDIDTRNAAAILRTVAVELDRVAAKREA